MKISTIEIKNFRAIEYIRLNLQEYNCFVGPNGAGKSTMLQAINLFFGEFEVQSDTDFFQRDVSRSIEVNITFSDLSASAASEFKHYYRSGFLTISAEIRHTAGKYERSVKGDRLVFEPFQSFFAAPSSPASERTKIYEALRQEFTELPEARSAAEREQALRAFEESLPDDRKVVIRSGSEFFGATKGASLIRKHAAWVYIPAVKDAAQEAQEA